MRRVDFAIDSTWCGDSSFTYRYYLLNPKDFLQIVYTVKSKPFVDHKTKTNLYSQEERVTDFTTDSLFLMIRTDTIGDYSQRNDQINKIFSFKILKEKQAIYEEFKADYKRAWELNLHSNN